MVRLAQFVLRHKMLVALFWLVAMLAGGATSGTTVDRLSFDFSLPGQPGFETEKKLLETYGSGPDEGTTIVAVTVPSGTTVDDEQAAVDGVFEAVQENFPQYRVAWEGNTGSDRFTTENGRTAYGVIVDEKFTSFTFEPAFRKAKDLFAAQAQETGFEVRTTGYIELSEGNAESSEGGEPPSVLSETLLGAFGALIVLLFVFASFMAFVPLVIALVSILSTFLCVLAVSYLTDISFVVQFLIALVGLGVAIDYSLLVVTRWREEREHGRENGAAVVEAMRTAGSAVVASAATVAISLVALIVVPVPFLRSMGIGGMLIPIVSSLVVLTLLPALLAGIGPKVDWPRVRHENSASKAWSAWARGISSRRFLAAGVGFVLLGLLVAPVFDIRVGQARTESLAKQGPAVEALADLRAGGVPAGIVTPLEILVGGNDAEASAEQVVRQVGALDGVAFTVFPDDPTWRKAGTAVVSVIPERELVDIQAAEVVERIRDTVAGIDGVVGVAGPGATVLDYSDAVFKRFPLVMALIALVTFLLLVRAFRSLLLPLKAVLLNVLSVAATFGFVVLFWQKGYGSEAVFDVTATGAVTFWLPVLIFAFLFGLSM
ncbi:MAG: MMPL family transporter, partial [Actinobacteria bacterium]|nr:MMPL family transporter [Actinomycetota bacterium]